MHPTQEQLINVCVKMKTIKFHVRLLHFGAKFACLELVANHAMLHLAPSKRQRNSRLILWPINAPDLLKIKSIDCKQCSCVIITIVVANQENAMR